ncbi:MAG: type II secretion system F family protein [Elusimicrobiota bacterium]
MIIKILALLIIFIAVFVLLFALLSSIKITSDEERKLPFIIKLKNTIAIHKQFMKIESINRKAKDIWIGLGKPSYPLPEDIVVTKQLLGFVALIFIWLLFKSIILGIIAGVIVFYFADIIFKNQIAKRYKDIEKNLPSSIDLLTLCVDAGIDFMSAVSKIIENTEKNALTEEFQEIVRELQLGADRRTALKNFSKRCEIDDVTAFVSVVVQAEELGTSLVEVLRSYAEQMRINQMQKLEKQAMEAPTKMLFPMIMFIFPGVFILIFGPIILQLVDMF